MAKTLVKTNSARSFSEYLLSQARLDILHFLAKWRFATTTHINQELQAGKSAKHTSGDLAALRQAGLVQSYELVTSLGNRSELCWLLTRPGAAAIEVPYNSKYNRHPSPERLTLRSMEFELIRTASFADGNFELIQPTNYSPARPLIKPTPQSQRLSAIVDHVETTKIKTAIEQDRLNPRGQSAMDLENKTHLWSLPEDCNEYLTYSQDDPDRAAIVILCPPSAAERFWLSKLESYAKLVSKQWIEVWGCFYSKEDRLAGDKVIVKIENSETIEKWSRPILMARKAQAAPSAAPADSKPVLIKTVVIDQLYELFMQLGGGQ